MKKSIISVKACEAGYQVDIEGSCLSVSGAFASICQSMYAAGYRLSDLLFLAQLCPSQSD